MAKKKRSAARAAAAAVDSDKASKKAAPEVYKVSVEVIWPPNVSPQTAKLTAQHESKRSARQAKKEATSEKQYGRENEEDFAKLFEATVASAFAKEGPVSLSKVITAMTKATGKVKITKRLKEKWCWDGFVEGRWQISRHVDGKGLVAFPKGAAMNKKHDNWKFSPLSTSEQDK